jgi:hypothetical protein
MGATNPGVRSEPIQSALADYLQTTRAREWRGDEAASGDDPVTARAIARLEREVRTEAARTEAGTPTSTELLVNAGALAFRSSVRTSLLVVGLASVVGLSLALLFSLSAPWRGPLTASGHPIDAVVRDIQTGFFDS